LSNASTAGYKADREFYNLWSERLPVIESNWTDFSQGLLAETRNPLDLALQGRGFFAADSPAGPLFTRSGNFHVSRAGVLETAEGYTVRAVGGDRKMRIPAGRENDVTIDADGSVRLDGGVVGRLDLADFSQRESIAKHGGNYFRLVDPKATIGRAAGAEVHQGRLENSNVAPGESAVRLVSVMRQFEMLQRALALGGEMNRRAVEEVAKVSG
ncbi:MAG: flagellar hook-basal body protein, partial [Bryobacteraceae bacterium]